MSYSIFERHIANQKIEKVAHVGEGYYLYEITCRTCKNSTHFVSKPDRNKTFSNSSCKCNYIDDFLGEGI